MAGLRQLTPLGTAVSYNNASFSLAGRVLERVADQPYEDALRSVLPVAPNGDGISLEAVDRPEVLAELGVELEQEPPVPFRFLAGEGDRIVCVAPPYRGSTGFFVRDASGVVTALNAFGRHARTG